MASSHIDSLGQGPCGLSKCGVEFTNPDTYTPDERKQLRCNSATDTNNIQTSLGQDLHLDQVPVK